MRLSLSSPPLFLSLPLSISGSLPLFYLCLGARLYIYIYIYLGGLCVDLLGKSNMLVNIYLFISLCICFYTNTHTHTHICKTYRTGFFILFRLYTRKLFSFSALLCRVYQSGMRECTAAAQPSPPVAAPPLHPSVQLSAIIRALKLAWERLRI